MIKIKYNMKSFIIIINDKDKTYYLVVSNYMYQEIFVILDLKGRQAARRQAAGRQAARRLKSKEVNCNIIKMCK